MKYVLLTIKKMLRYLLKPLSFVPALCMMYLIFTFSAQNGAESTQLSAEVGTNLISSINEIFKLHMEPVQLAHYMSILHVYIRKLAHVTEYFLLAVSVALPLYVYRLRGFWLLVTAGAFCVCFACLDEYHQSFVAGRSASARDVAIDSIGILIGIYTTRIFGFIGRKTVFAPLSMSRKRQNTRL